MTDDLGDTHRSLEGTQRRRVATAAPTELPRFDAARYAIGRELGRGAQSLVHVAFDAAVGREVALKLVHDANDGGAFVREARITGQLEHPGIVPVYELGRDERGQPYCTQKLVRGKSLRVALDECTTREQRLALLPHLIDVCNAVAYAHSRGVVHRDLKPDNVMVGEFGETVVLDWGIAKILGADDAQPAARPLEGLSPQATQQGSILGTPLYLSPEQATGNVQAVDARSDVWSLGVMLYELVTGALPFHADTLPELLERVARAEYLALPRRLPDVSPELAAIVEHALRKDPARRFADAAALARELAAFRAGGRLSVYEYSSWELLRRFLRRNRALSAVVAAATVGVVAAGSVAWANYRRAEASLLESRRRLADQFLTAAGAAQGRLDWTDAHRLFQSARDTAPSPHASWGLAFTAPLAVTPSLVRRDDVGPVEFAHLSGDGARALLGTARDVHLFDGSARLARWPREGDAVLSPGGDVVVFLAASVSVARGPDWSLRTLPVPDATAAAISPDGARVALARGSGAVELYDVATLALLGGLPDGPKPACWVLAFDADGQRLVGASREGHVAVWDLTSRTKTHAWRLRSFPYVLLLDRERLLAGDLVRFIEVARLDQQAPPQTVSAHDRGVIALRRSTDGRLLASNSQDGTIVLWDAATLGPLQRFTPDEPVLALAFTADAGALDTIDRSGRRQRWDLTRLPRVWRAVEPGAFVHDLAMPGPRGEVAWVHGANALSVADDTSRTDHAPDAGAYALAATPTELTLGLRTGAARWDRRTRAFVGDLAPGAPFIRALTWSADGQRLWLARGTTVEAWGRSDGAAALVLDAGTSTVFGLALSPDATRVAWANGDGVQLRSAADGAPLSAVPFGGAGTRAVAFSSDGALLATGSSVGEVTVADGHTGAPRCRVTGHRAAVFDVLFAPGRRVFATGGLDRAVRLWSHDCQLLAVAPPLHHEVLQLAWSPDGAFLAVADTMGAVTRLHVAVDQLP